MLKKILPWVGGIFALIGVVLIFLDVINSIKKRDKTKTNIVGLVLLAIGIAGYIVTDLVLPAVKEDNAWPALASLVWIALFWVYVILDAVVTLGDIRQARRKKREQKLADSEQDASLSEENRTESSAESADETIGEQDHRDEQPVSDETDLPKAGE